MDEKKIATSIDVLINVGNYEHIQITKYSEKKITYETPEEMVKKEDEFTSELTSDIIRTMRGLPERLGKKTDAVVVIEEKIQKKIPEWLANNPVPNLAKDKFESTQAKVSNEVSTKKEKENMANNEADKLVESSKSTETNKPIDLPKEQIKAVDLGSDDLFGDEDLFK